MFEIRQDYLTQTLTFMSKARSLRPNFFADGKSEASLDEQCPFCAENCSSLVDIISVDYNGRIIILKNKFPAIGGEIGAHEVMIDTDIHWQKFISFSAEEMMYSLKSIIKRGIELGNYENTKYVQLFKNDGKGSGASIDHSHWQLLAMPFVPQKQMIIHGNFEKYFIETRKSYIENLYEQKNLILYENGGAFAYIPHASPYEYNINIAPIKHVSTMADLDDGDIGCLGDALKATLAGLYEKLGDFPFNICLQNAPKGEYRASHFYMEIIPRRGSFAGLELSTQTYISGRFPEEQAADLAQFIRKI